MADPNWLSDPSFMDNSGDDFLNSIFDQNQGQVSALSQHPQPAPPQAAQQQPQQQSQQQQAQQMQPFQQQPQQHQQAQLFQQQTQLPQSLQFPMSGPQAQMQPQLQLQSNTPQMRPGGIPQQALPQQFSSQQQIPSQMQSSQDLNSIYMRQPSQQINSNKQEMLLKMKQQIHRQKMQAQAQAQAQALSQNPTPSQSQQFQTQVQADLSRHVSPHGSQVPTPGPNQVTPTMGNMSNNANVQTFQQQSQQPTPHMPQQNVLQQGQQFPMAQNQPFQQQPMPLQQQQTQQQQQQQQRLQQKASISTQISAETFQALLFDFMSRRGTPINQPISINNKRVSLFMFFCYVQNWVATNN